MYAGTEIPVPRGASMTPDDNETRAETEHEATGSSSGPVRDPETGKFLPKDDGGDDEPATADDTDESRTTPDERADAEPDEPRSVGPERAADEQPAPPTSGSEWRSDRPDQPLAAPPRQTVFVPNPDGYPRPPTMYLPVVPWLRLPSHPPAHDTVTLPTASNRATHG